MEHSASLPAEGWTGKHNSPLSRGPGSPRVSPSSLRLESRPPAASSLKDPSSSFCPDCAFLKEGSAPRRHISALLGPAECLSQSSDRATCPHCHLVDSCNLWHYV